MSTTPPPTSTPEPAPAPSPILIEQYKAKMLDLGNLGTRYTSMTTYYVSAVSAIFAVLALKEKSIGAIATTTLLVVCGAGFLVALLWAFSVSFFRRLFGAKLTVLSEMEKGLPHETFRAELEILKKVRFRSWTAIEQFVPITFSLFFLALIGLKLAGAL